MMMSKKIIQLVSAFMLMALVTSPLYAEEDWSKLSDKKQTNLGLYMTAQQAHDYILENADKTLFLDIRTPGELNYLGMADLMDYHVPYVYMDRSKWDEKKTRYVRVKNANFVSDIEDRLQKKGLTKSDTVIVMCRSGKRSAEAVNILSDAGFTQVYSVVDGYEGDKAKEGETKGQRTVNGWKNSGLPWTYHLDGERMYFIEE